MSVKAISPYNSEPRDKLENFNGKQLVSLFWDNHLIFAAPLAFLVDPEISFDDFLQQYVLPAISAHPESKLIELEKIKWKLNLNNFIPNFKSSLISNDINHKSILTMTTPGLKGIQNSGS